MSKVNNLISKQIDQFLTSKYKAVYKNLNLNFQNIEVIVYHKIKNKKLNKDNLTETIERLKNDLEQIIIKKFMKKIIVIQLLTSL